MRSLTLGPAVAVVGALIVYYGGKLGILLFFVFMGGALAYIGDQLGIYWGKKRVSIMGMRPKNTAMVISVITGLIITLLTLFIASYFNENFQIALFKTEELRLKQKELNEKLSDLLIQQAKMLENNKRLRKTKLELEEAKDLLLEERRELEKKIAEIEESLVQLREDKVRKIAEIERLSRIVEKKETGLVVVHKGQTLVESPVLVRTDAGREEIKRVVVKLLGDLKQTVESRGISIDDKPFERAVAVLPASIMKKLASIRKVGRDNGRNVDACCIQPVSDKNVSIGENLQSVTFEVKPNLLVFHSDEEVARTYIDGRMAEENILDQLFYFDKQVLSVLRDKGVSRTSLRIRTRKISARQLVNFYRIMKLIRELGRVVMVRFVTVSNVYSYGEIDAIYKVEELRDPWSRETRELGSGKIADIFPASNGETKLSTGVGIRTSAAADADTAGAEVTPDSTVVISRSVTDSCGESPVASSGLPVSVEKISSVSAAVVITGLHSVWGSPVSFPPARPSTWNGWADDIGN